MKFELLPVLAVMTEYYSSPVSDARFANYLRLLHGTNENDMHMPVAGFNPMAKEHMYERLLELQRIGMESFMQKSLAEVNEFLGDSGGPVFKVAFNLADDLKGGWTNRYTADYDSKFRVQALYKRNFTVPVFWMTETVNPKIFYQRTAEYCLRTYYQSRNAKARSLKEHVEQEIAAAAMNKNLLPFFDHAPVNAFYEANKDEQDYSLIFNFFYGDAASESLGMKGYGITEPFAGYKFAAWMSKVLETRN